MKTPSLHPDGVSVRGCTIIYPPRGQAGEYSELAANPYVGCGHKCAYCYVPKIPGQPDRQTFDAGAIVKANYQDRFSADLAKYAAAGSRGQVMISFTSDPYPPAMHLTTRWMLEQMKWKSDLAFCTLTKGGKRALRDIDIFRPTRDAFASTLTSLDDRFSQKWERDAALPADRIATLRRFHERGIFTWVSLEPTIDCEASLAIVDATHEFVDLYKVGRVNYLGITRTTDWRTYTLRMIDKLQALGKAHYIKKDLQPFLPAEYHNPLRVQQHH
jgi:DNA repair photolyase